jgi:trans-aconitate methyltransferase
VTPEREQRTVFGEVAEQYDEARPGYPDAVFDAILEFGALDAGALAVEIGAGTGKATLPMRVRGVDVRALEPSPEMAAVLRAKGVAVEVTSFEDWVPDDEYDLLYAAQAWHWVHADDRYDRVAAALGPEATAAFFWNTPREWTGALGKANDAAYEKYAPHMSSSVRRWSLDSTLDELDAHDAFGAAEKRVMTWTQEYSRAAYLRLLGTHSDHRMLDDDVRTRLHDAVGRVIDANGGTVDVTYNVNLYLAFRL